MYCVCICNGLQVQGYVFNYYLVERLMVRQLSTELQIYFVCLRSVILETNDNMTPFIRTHLPNAQLMHQK